MLKSNSPAVKATSYDRLIKAGLVDANAKVKSGCEYYVGGTPGGSCM